MITINISVKNLLIIAGTIGQNPADMVYRLLKEINNSVQDKLSNLSQLSAVSISIQELKFVTELLGRQNEKNYAEVNNTVKGAVLSAISTFTPEQQLELGTFFGAYNAEIDNNKNVMMNAGLATLGLTLPTE